MIVHVLGEGSMFTKEFYRMISEKFDKKEHVFLGTYKKGGVCDRLEGCRIVSPSSVKEMLQVLKEADMVIFHSLFIKNTLLLAAMPWLAKKTVWIIWGGDVYSQRKEHLTVKEKIAEAIKRRLAPRFLYTGYFSAPDVECAKALYGLDTEAVKVSYPVAGSHEDLVQQIKAEDPGHEGINILLGNSATVSNCHKEALSLLSVFKDEDIHLYMTLSYGGEYYKEYREEVIAFAKELFPEGKVFPVMDCMENDDYLRFLNSMDVAVFYNNRSQAMGNISQLTLCGSKVFIREGTSMWKHFADLGYVLYKAEGIAEMPFEEFIRKDPEIVRQNTELVAQLHNIDRKCGMWRTLLANAEAERKKR